MFKCPNCGHEEDSRLTPEELARIDRLGRAIKQAFRDDCDDDEES